jgi:hypothetical protein
MFARFGHSALTVALYVGLSLLWIVCIPVCIASWCLCEWPYEQWLTHRSRRSIARLLLRYGPMTPFSLAYVWRPDARDLNLVMEERIVRSVLHCLVRQRYAVILNSDLPHERGYTTTELYVLTTSGAAILSATGDRRPA